MNSLMLHPKCNRRGHEADTSRRFPGETTTSHRRLPVSRALLKRIFTIGVAVLTSWVFSNGAVASDASTAFDAANKLYEAGKFTEAAGAYEQLIQSGHVSDTLYFNLGNACYKAGNNGLAIAAYRRAAQMSPRDPSVRFNLQFVRHKVNGNDTVADPWWHRALHALGLNEWTVLTALGLWLWFLLLALAQWRPSLKTTLQKYLLACGLVTVFLAIFLGARAQDYYFDQPAIVTAREAVVRKGPLADSQSAFAVQDGMELAVLDQKGDWLEVSDAHGRSGWLKRTEVLELRPGA